MSSEQATFEMNAKLVQLLVRDPAAITLLAQAVIKANPDAALPSTVLRRLRPNPVQAHMVGALLAHGDEPGVRTALMAIDRVAPKLLPALAVMSPTPARLTEALTAPPVTEAYEALLRAQPGFEDGEHLQSVSELHFVAHGFAFTQAAAGLELPPRLAYLSTHVQDMAPEIQAVLGRAALVCLDAVGTPASGKDPVEVLTRQLREDRASLDRANHGDIFSPLIDADQFTAVRLAKVAAHEPVGAQGGEDMTVREALLCLACVEESSTLTWPQRELLREEPVGARFVPQRRASRDEPFGLGGF